jgi:tryptophan 2,3-dioxygenase
MTNDNHLDQMENHLIDMRLAVSVLLETVTQHQRNFETIQRNFEVMQRNFGLVMTEIRDIRVDMRDMQAEIRGLQTENRRTLDILQGKTDNEDTQ